MLGLHSSIMFFVLLLHGVCVKFTEQQKIERIYGGRPTSTTYYPFMVSIKYQSEPKDHKCGGTIINTNTILTAAHCAQFEKVVAGATYKNDEAYAHDVKWIKVHEDFSLENMNMHDIAIARIFGEFRFGPSVMPIELSSATYVPPGTVGIVVGWGGRSYETRGSVERDYPLQVTAIPVISNEDCEIDYFGWPTLDSIICSVDADAKKSTCKGDSGGPLIINNQQVGITSMGSPCGWGEQHIYTKVGYYWDWIHSNVRM